MHKVDIPVDPREEAAIRFRRQRDAERLARIKSNVGGDQSAWEQQIEDKRQRKQLDEAREAAIAQEMARQERIVQLLAKRQQDDLKALSKTLTDYYQTQQHKTQRREYDLNDPLSNRNAAPIRAGDEDPRLGVSSVQIMLGEDLTYEARLELQKQQMKAWCEEQSDIKRQQVEQSEEEAHVEYLREKEMAIRAKEIEIAHLEAKKAQRTATSELNKLLVAEKKELERMKKEQEMYANVDEINSTVRGILKEDPYDAIMPGTNKILKDKWRGFTPDQLAAIKQEQLEQMRAANAGRETSKQMTLNEQHMAKLEHKASIKAQNQYEKQKKALLQAQVEENARLAELQKERQRLEKLNRANHVSDSYFDQFGNSAR